MQSSSYSLSRTGQAQAHYRWKRASDLVQNRHQVAVGLDAGVVDVLCSSESALLLLSRFCFQTLLLSPRIWAGVWHPSPPTHAEDPSLSAESDWQGLCFPLQSVKSVQDYSRAFVTGHKQRVMRLFVVVVGEGCVGVNMREMADTALISQSSTPNHTTPLQRRSDGYDIEKMFG